jgi:hypothetical protein
MTGGGGSKCRTHLPDGGEAGLVVVVVLFELAALGIKDVDEHLCVREERVGVGGDGGERKPMDIVGMHRRRTDVCEEAFGKMASRGQRHTATFRKMVCFCDTK